LSKTNEDIKFIPQSFGYYEKNEPDEYMNL